MATTSPDNLRTPNPGDSYNLVPDLATLANDVQAALLTRSARFGTAAQRAAFLSTAPAGFLWQDTDSIGMLWKKAGAVWVPAVWSWSGTTTQRTAFTQAPNGFSWFNTTTGKNSFRISGSWVDVTLPPFAQAMGEGSWASAIATGSGVTIAVTFPAGRFTVPPIVTVQSGSGRLNTGFAVVPSTSGFSIRLDNFSGASANGPIPYTWKAVQMTSGSASG